MPKFHGQIDECECIGAFSKGEEAAACPEEAGAERRKTGDIGRPTVFGMIRALDGVGNPQVILSNWRHSRASGWLGSGPVLENTASALAAAPAEASNDYYRRLTRTRVQADYISGSLNDLADDSAVKSDAVWLFAHSLFSRSTVPHSGHGAVKTSGDTNRRCDEAEEGQERARRWLSDLGITR